MDELLRRFVELYGQPLTPQYDPVPLEIVPARALPSMPPIAVNPVGDIAEFYSKLQFEEYLYPPHGLSVFFNPYHSIREMALGWAIEEDENSNMEFYPEWEAGECVFFATEIEDGALFVQLASGTVYGMFTGGSEQYPLAPRFRDFLDVVLQIADIEKHVPRYGDNHDFNPDYQRKALEILDKTLEPEYAASFAEYFELNFGL